MLRLSWWKITAPVLLGSFGLAVATAKDAAAPGRSQKAVTVRSISKSTPDSKLAPDAAKSALDAETDASDTGTVIHAAATEDESESGAPKRYIRQVSGEGSTRRAGATPKNYYNELFGDGKAPARGNSAAGSAADKKFLGPTLDRDEEEAARNAEAAALIRENQFDEFGERIEPGKARRESAAEKAARMKAEASRTADASAGKLPNKKMPLQRPAVKAAPPKAKPVDPVTDDEDWEDDFSDEDFEPAPAPVAKPKAIAAERAEKAPPPALKSRMAAQAKAAAPAPQPSKSTVKPVAARSNPSLAPVNTARPAVASDSDAERPTRTTPRVSVSSAATLSPSSTSNVELQTASITLRWVARGEVSVGDECKCALLVRNNSPVPASDMFVEANFPRHVMLIKAEPHPTSTQEVLTWKINKMAPGEERTIEITMVPSRRGPLSATATVRTAGTASTVLQVEEPQLQITANGPTTAMVGESVTHTVRVSNPGSGVAHDVFVIATLPSGLSHPDGSTVRIGLGALAAGDSREVKLPFAATAGGSHSVTFEARGGTSLVHSATATVNITAPRLEIATAGPGLRYINRAAVYTATVSNNGAAATNNVRVQHIVPNGCDFVAADKGGKFDYNSRTVSWFLGRLEANTSQQLTVEITPKETGVLAHTFLVQAEAGVSANSTVETRVEGTAAVVMEVADLNDPVEVNTETGWEIHVRNDGSKSARTVGLACELPPGVELISATGPTPHISNRGTVTFKSIGELQPKQSVTFRVIARGTQAGDLRFRARLTSEGSNEPTVLDEVTKFYAD